MGEEEAEWQLPGSVCGEAPLQWSWPFGPWVNLKEDQAGSQTPWEQGGDIGGAALPPPPRILPRDPDSPHPSWSRAGDWDTSITGTDPSELCVRFLGLPLQIPQLGAYLSVLEARNPRSGAGRAVTDSAMPLSELPGGPWLCACSLGGGRS